jgi:UDP-GlcNAc:undecaprenyl-phosphate/decaprenyl-phosphate GlcNAc-1-phosphate transferase
MRDYLYILIIAAVVTYLLTPLVRRGSIAIKAQHAPRDRDVHEKPTPLLGGIAMYCGLVAGLLVAERLTYLQHAFPSSDTVLGLLLAGGLLVLVGAVDDRWGLGVISRLAGQIAAGGILIWSGAYLPWIPLPGGTPFLLEPDLSYTLTILIVVVTINAVNFIDGLDGLAAGVVGISAVAYLVYSYNLTNSVGVSPLSVPATVSAVLAGICLGFLPHNFHPARIFMGDTGAYLLGLLLAYGPISSTASLDPNVLVNYSHLHPINRFGTILPLLVPVAIMIIPYADLLLAVVRRTLAGKSPFAADGLHLHHRLLNMGHSQRQSVLLMYLWAALFSGTVVGLSVIRSRLIWLALATVGIMAVLLLATTMPRLRLWAASPAGKRTLPADGRGRSGDLGRSGSLRESGHGRTASKVVPSPGTIAPGVLPSSGLPGSGLPNGGFPIGAVPGGVPPNGGFPGAGFPAGGFPNSGLSNEVAPDRGVPYGVVPDGPVPDGGVPDGGALNRAAPDGALPNRPVPPHPLAPITRRFTGR